jgi:hypothetical protein
MKFRTYEFLNDPVYRDQYCICLSPGRPIWDRSEKENKLIDHIIKEAHNNFDLTSLGDRVFFSSDEERQKFITWYTLKWS